MGYPTGERQRIEGEKREGMESAIGAGGGEAWGPYKEQNRRRVLCPVIT